MVPVGGPVPRLDGPGRDPLHGLGQTVRPLPAVVLALLAGLFVLGLAGYRARSARGAAQASKPAAGGGTAYPM